MTNTVLDHQSNGYDTDTGSIVSMRGMTLVDLKNRAMEAGIIGTSIRNRYTRHNRGKLIDDIILAEKLRDRDVTDITPPSSVSVSPNNGEEEYRVPKTTEDGNHRTSSVPRVWKSSKDVVDDEIHEVVDTIPNTHTTNTHTTIENTESSGDDDTYTTLGTVITLASTVLIGAVAIMCAKFGAPSSPIGRVPTNIVPPKTTKITRSMLSSDM